MSNEASAMETSPSGRWGDGASLAGGPRAVTSRVARSPSRAPGVNAVSSKENPVARAPRHDAILALAAHHGRLPERPKGADCKSAGIAYVGSNPTPATRARTARDLGRPGHGPFRLAVSGPSNSSARRRRSVTPSLR